MAREDATGRLFKQIKQGAIGTLREIHNWSNRPVWPQYSEIPQDRPPIPKGFDWDLWLGPTLDRPYHPHYTHTVFRGWYDFGGGSMADMGIYSLWPVLTGLGLDAPFSAEAWATHSCSIVDQISGPAKNDFSYPAACTFRFKFAPQKDLPAVELFWYDGGMRPRLPEEIAAHYGQMPAEGILFIGNQGAIMAGFNGQNPHGSPRANVNLCGRKSLRRRLTNSSHGISILATSRGCRRAKGANRRREVSSTLGRFPMPSTWVRSHCVPERRSCSTARTGKSPTRPTRTIFGPPVPPGLGVVNRTVGEVLAGTGFSP